MCNNCNGGCPGLLNLLFGRPRVNGCGNSRQNNGGCGCGGGGNNGVNPINNNGCGQYDAYYAAQYALNGNGCGFCGSVSTYSVSGYGFGGGQNNGLTGVNNVNSCGCSQCNPCGF